MRTIPLVYTGNGTFRCLPAFQRRVDADFKRGVVMNWCRDHDRSSASHRRYFAILAKVWQRLPEKLAGNYDSPTHLRKWALIRSDFKSEQRIRCADAAAAKALVVLLERIDPYSVVTISRRTVCFVTARSQARSEMSAQEFEKSKDRVVAICSRLIGVDARTLAT